MRFNKQIRREVVIDGVLWNVAIDAAGVTLCPRGRRGKWEFMPWSALASLHGTGELARREEPGAPTVTFNDEEYALDLPDTQDAGAAPDDGEVVHG